MQNCTPDDSQSNEQLNNKNFKNLGIIFLLILNFSTSNYKFHFSICLKQIHSEKTKTVAICD